MFDSMDTWKHAEESMNVWQNIKPVDPRRIHKTDEVSTVEATDHEVTLSWQSSIDNDLNEVKVLLRRLRLDIREKTAIFTNSEEYVLEEKGSTWIDFGWF